MGSFYSPFGIAWGGELLLLVACKRGPASCCTGEGGGVRGLGCHRHDQTGQTRPHGGISRETLGSCWRAVLLLARLTHSRSLVFKSVHI